MNLKHPLLYFEADSLRCGHMQRARAATARTICFKLKQWVLQIHVCLAATKFEAGLLQLLFPQMAVLRTRKMSGQFLTVDFSNSVVIGTSLGFFAKRRFTLVEATEWLMLTPLLTQVTRMFFPLEVQYEKGLVYNLALLELRQPMQVMPLCVDWTDSAVLRGIHGGTVRLGANMHRMGSLHNLEKTVSNTVSQLAMCFTSQFKVFNILFQTQVLVSKARPL